MIDIISIVGNYGKSIFSYQLANVLSKTHKVVVLATSPIKPMYNLLFPQKAPKKNNRSLGKLLSLPLVSDQDVFANANIINDNLLYISYAENESLNTYPEVTDINCAKLFLALDKIADYIILDTSSFPTTIDEFALANKNSFTICVSTTDLKGFYSRQRYKNINAHILWNQSEFGNIQDTLVTAGEKPYFIPYYKKMQSAFNGLDITDIFLPKKYKSVLLSISNEITTESKV